MKIRLFGTANDSIVDGPGMRYTVFCQGCYHNCKGCHNPESHDIHGGYEKEIDEIIQEIDDNPLLDGVTLSGGEPMLQVEPLIEVCKLIKERGLNIVVYSGYLYEQILQLSDKHRELLLLCDMLVDGKFELDKRSLSLLYRGSSNQRLINLKESRKQNKVVEYNIDNFGQIKL